MIDLNIHIAGMTRNLIDQISNGQVKDSDIPKIANDIIKQKRMQLKPSIAGHPAEGQIMLDALGRKAMVFPDGSIKEIG